MATYGAYHSGEEPHDFASDEELAAAEAAERLEDEKANERRPSFVIEGGRVMEVTP